MISPNIFKILSTMFRHRVFQLYDTLKSHFNFEGKSENLSDQVDTLSSIDPILGAL